MSDLGYITHCSICREPHKPTQPGWYKHATRAECITALRAALDQERAKVRELAESPPLASISLCCKIVRIGRWDEATMHDGGCYERNGRKLGPTYYLHDVSALLSGRGETTDE
jgi:hypothetical protein